jgi:hypothetical protein
LPALRQRCGQRLRRQASLQLAEKPARRLLDGVGRARPVEQEGAYRSRPRQIALAQEIARLTQALVDGRIGLAAWERGMAQELKDLYLQQAALARGGWQNLTAADKRRVTLLLKEQYRFLDGFARDIAAGKLSAAQILWRAGLYPMGARQSYWKARDADEKGRGRRQERRIAVGEEGTCSPCTDLAALGWRPIGMLPAPGGPPCAGINLCRCEKEYR